MAVNPQRIEQLLELFHERARIAAALDMTLSFDEEGNATIDMPYNPDLDHGLGGIHGGIYCTVIDSAGWFTAGAHHPESVWMATSELTIHFLAPAKEIAIRAEGRAIKVGKRQTLCEIKLFDANGKLIGHSTGTFVALPNVEWTAG